MDSPNPENPPPPVVEAPAKRHVWKFWATALWGLFAFAALFAGQALVLVYEVLRSGDWNNLQGTVRAAASDGMILSLSVITGLPAVVLALWLAISFTSSSFAEYLALRGTSWKNFLIGAVGMGAILGIWEVLSRVFGHESDSGFMVEIMKSALTDRTLPIMIFAFCVAAPVSEEFFARGFLYQGWSQTWLRPVGAIILSSLVWTRLHLQYDVFSLGQVFSLGLWFGYLRYRSGSTWLTIVLHGMNNLAAVIQTIWLAGQG
jgi:membrane protease YdiL (CAAX protease family)